MMPDSLKPEDYVRRPVLPRLKPCDVCRHPATTTIRCDEDGSAIHLCNNTTCARAVIDKLVTEVALANHRAQAEPERPPIKEFLLDMFIRGDSVPVYWFVATICSGFLIVFFLAIISFFKALFS